MCCESTRFEHRVIVDRGANETCPRSAGVRSAAHVAARSASSTMRAIVSRSAGCASATLPQTKFPFKEQGSAFSDKSRVLLFAFSIHESGSHPVSSQDGQSQGSARQSCVQRAGRVALRRADARAHRCPSTLCRQGPRPRGGVGRRPRADGQGQTAGSNCRCEVS